MKGAFFSCGQNCAGAERFFVQAGVYDSFVSQVADITNGMRQGHALGASPVDCGAMCMPGLAEKVAELVDDAVQRGAKVKYGCFFMLCKGKLCCLVSLLLNESPA